MKPFIKVPSGWLDKKGLFLAGRPTTEIIIHCSATPPTSDWSVQRIDALHRAPPRNWNGIGYHFYITKDGTIWVGRPLDQIGAHVKGRNKYTIGVCYEGGVVRRDDKLIPKDTRTKQQAQSLIKLVEALRRDNRDIIRISGHNEYANKACPSFDVGTEFRKTNQEIYQESPTWKSVWSVVVGWLRSLFGYG